MLYIDQARRWEDAEIAGIERTGRLEHRYLSGEMAPDVPNKVQQISGKAASKFGGECSKRAYVTFLAGDGDYVKGVVGLARGLRKAGAAYPLVVAVLPDVPRGHRELLQSQGCLIREIEPLYPPPSQVQFAMAYYVVNYSKLRIWTFEEYSKMIYLDADIQVYENIDELLDMEDGYLYAVMDCFCEKTWSETPQYKIGYCQQSPNKVQWPSELGHPPPLYFNAGMFVFEPSKLTFEALIRALVVTPPTPFAEQDFLNVFFQKIYRPIPLIYNLVLAMLWRHPERVDLDKVKVVHYCAAGSKPWRYTSEEENMNRDDIRMLVKRWWDIYNDASLDLQKESTHTRMVISEAEALSGLRQITCLRGAIPTLSNNGFGVSVPTAAAAKSLMATISTPLNNGFRISVPPVA